MIVGAVKLAATGLLAVGLLVAGAGPASAHATLISVDPPDGARLDESPDAVTLTFSEPVSADLGGVRVLDGDGSRVDEGAVRVEGPVVSVDVASDLPDGTYVVSYRVISADGHPVRGGSVFGVGEGTVDTDALGRVTGGGDDRRWEVIGGVGRGIAYAGVLVAAGGALFLTTAHRVGRERARLVRLVRLAALAGGLGAVVALPVQAALGTGQGALSLLDDGVLADVAADGVGLGLALGLSGLALLVVGLDRSTPAALVGSVVAAGSFAATGHTRAGETALLATVADVAHLLAAAVWVGGIVLLAACLRLRGTDEGIDPVETGGIVARFSRWATASILVVGTAGVVLGWSEVRALDALTSTGYGRALLAKVALVAVIAGLGAYNHFRLVPAIERGKARAGLARLRNTIRVEAVVLVGVLALTSLLVVLTPAKTEAGSRVVEEIVSLGEAGSVQLVVSPATAGFNQIHVYTYDPTERPADIADSLSVELRLPAAGIGPIERELPRAGPAHFQLNGDDLAVAGRWELTIRARIDRFSEATATVEIDVAG